MTIYLLKDFNKYSNRILKLDDITSLQDKICGTYSNINFVENDGVSAEIILNRNILEASNPDYLMAVSSTDGEYDSNWFIMSSTRLRTGQVKYKLRRDLIRDNWDSIKESTLFINKGYVPYGNSLFFNPENISVNQILHKVTYLTDTSKCAWLVAYIAKGVESKSISFGNSGSIAANLTLTQAQFKAAYHDSESYLYGGRVNIAINGRIYKFDIETGQYWFQGLAPSSIKSYITRNGTFDAKAIVQAIRDYVADNINGISFTKQSTLDDAYTTTNGYVIKSNSNYYTVNPYYLDLDNNITYSGGPHTVGTNLNVQVGTAMMATDNVSTGDIEFTNVKYKKLQYTFTDKTTATDSITYNNVGHTVGATYDVVCCPYIATSSLGNQFTVKIKNSNGTFSLNPDLCKDLFSQLSVGLASSNVYDAQILPYCPLGNIKVYESDDNSITLNMSGYEAVTAFSKTTNACLIYSGNYQRSFTINNSSATNWHQYKKDYITHSYKMVAPNFSSELDIDPNKNNTISKYHVQMTCLPYSPWISIHPQYNWLNGLDNDDANSLILGGSFNISQLTNDWSEYVYNNSNYSQIFENQLSYQQYQQKMNMISSAISGVSSAIGSGVSSGLLMGSLPGTAGFGAVAGGITAGLSLGALGADLAVQNSMNKKANEYMTTQYQLQLGNIQAKPSTLSKITAFNISTKLYPMVYEYTCTDEEQEMVDEYFKYNGMTINSAGKIEDYVERNTETFVSARILRWSDTSNTQSDYNYLVNINSELQEGIYIKWQD